MSEWQPIETAPKDGTNFLACIGNAHADDWQCSLFIMFWCESGAYGDRDKGFWADWGQGLDSEEFDGHEEWSRRFDITHWMPLPTPPA